MIWIIAIVVVGLIAVLAELLLSYQKKSDELRALQVPIRRRIRAHQKAMQEAVEKIEGAAQGRLDELEMEMPAFANQLTGLGKGLTAVETELFGEDYDPNAPKEEEEEEDFLDKSSGNSDGKVAEEDGPEEAVNKARDLLEEVEGHRSSLERDVEVVKRTMALLEGKLRRGMGPATGN